MNTALDTEEKELIEFYESDKWVSISTPSLIDKYRKIARNTLQQKKIIDIEISSEDLTLLKEESLKKGFSYKSLIAAILHEHASQFKKLSELAS